MDLHLSNAILSATFSNEIRNTITGNILLAGASQSLSVELQGNFLSDIAGCLIEVKNPVPKIDNSLLAKLHTQQSGIAGEMTASRRTSQPSRRNAPPVTAAIPQSRGSLKNVVFFEWYNGQRQRVVIQAWHWTLQVSAPRWTMSVVEEREHIRAARRRRRDYLLAGDES